jgi:hypothetical protein
VAVGAAPVIWCRGSRRAALVIGVSCESIALIVTVVSLRWSAPLSDQYVEPWLRSTVTRRREDRPGER